LTTWHLKHARDKLLGQMFSEAADGGQAPITRKVEDPL